jgi:hypothetical protein
MTFRLRATAAQFMICIYIQALQLLPVAVPYPCPAAERPAPHPCICYRAVKPLMRAAVLASQL